MNVQTEEIFPGSEEYDIVTGQEIGINTPEDAVVEEIDVKNFLSTLQNYEEEWLKIYEVDEINIDELREKALNGDLRASRFRSIHWRCLLGVLHKDPQQWIHQLETYRQHYIDLKKELEINPRNVQDKIPHDNPLSQESQSAWQRYFCDKELRSVIEQDVIRTFPGVDFFRSSTVQEVMVGILFCYARQNPALCYRQGMHEILAPLLFVLHCDQQAYIHASESSDMLSDTVVIFNSNCLEADAYTLFKQIMAHIECSYRIVNLVPSSSGYFPSASSEHSFTENSTCENEVVEQLEYIKESILQTYDKELYLHLQSLDIPLQIFGIRWLRLLFGREFPLQDLLVLWDAIFAGKDFDLVNYIVVAMLIAIRQLLLEGDYTSCLTYLMRYPPTMDVSFIIQEALHLKDPQNYPKPQLNMTVLPNITVGGRGDLNRGPVTAGSKSNFKKKKYIPPIGAIRNEDNDVNIIDGYALDDPTLLRAELEHVKAVMALVRLKLAQYHSTLLHHIPLDSNLEVQLALDGMGELCSLLRSDNRPLSPVQVEPALEAGELSKSPTVKSAPKSRINSIQTKSNTLPKVISKPKQLTVFRESVGSDMVVGAPMTDPLNKIKGDYWEGSCESLLSLIDIHKSKTLLQSFNREKIGK